MTQQHSPYKQPGHLEPDDLELAERSLNGDLEAYSELARRHHGRLYQTIFAMVGDSDDADDLTQESFIKAYRSLGRFKGQSRFYTWIYRIAVNQTLDWMKAKKRRRDVPLEYAEGDRAGRVEGTDNGVYRRELNQHLEAALESLTPEYRATVVLREIDGRTYEEIAELLTCSVGTVKSRLFRARGQLRTLLEDVYSEVSRVGTVSHCAK